MDSMVGGVVAGFIASAIFFVVLALVRPRLAISPCIARTPTDDGEPEYRYRIKVVNLSRRACVDVNMTAFTVRSRKVPSTTEGEHGTVRVGKAVDLRRRPGGVIPGRTRRNVDATYAQRIRFDESTVNLLHDDDQRYEVLVRVTARDALSGFPRTFERRYALGSAIKDGTFAFGKSTEILPWTKQQARAHGLGVAAAGAVPSDQAPAVEPGKTET